MIEATRGCQGLSKLVKPGQRFFEKKNFSPQDTRVVLSQLKNVLKAMHGL